MSERVILITGGAKRVGAAMAEHLHAAGASVMVHYRSSTLEARALCERLNEIRPQSAAYVQADLLDTETLPSIILQTLDRFGRLDCLINNASSFYPTAVGAVTETDWWDLIGSNLKAPLFLSQAAAPHLKATQGSIINITDIHATRPLKGYLAYNVAKAGLQGLTASLARELAPDVRVNAIAPGPIAWPLDGQFDPAQREQIVASTPLKREGGLLEIARAAKFFIYDAPFVTGQTLAVDGGRSISI
jgi:pteridine reductase